MCLIACVCISLSVKADLIGHGLQFSQHIDDGYKLKRSGKNQDHWRIGIEYNDIYVSTFISSYDRRVWCVEKFNRNLKNINKNWSLGYRYGVCNGYKFGDYNKPFPLFMPSLFYTDGNFGLDFACIWNVCGVEGRYNFGNRFDGFIEDNISGDFFIGGGYSFKADRPDWDLYSVAYEEDIYRFEIIHWNDYTRTPYWDERPEWRHITNLIPAHNKLIVTARIFEYNFTENLSFFFNLGLAYSDKLSSVNSSHLLFAQYFGFEYYSFRATCAHESNAGLMGTNTGSDNCRAEYGWRF